MNLSDLQRRTVRAIVSLFETGSAVGGYSRVTLAPGDSGGLSYGTKQATRASGNLGLLVQAYCETEWAVYADELRPYLPRLLDGDPTLDEDEMLRTHLRIAAVDDPVMRDTQDAFFDRAFLDPALSECARLGFDTPLAGAIVYDSHIHGSYKLIRDRVPATLREREWCFAYLDERARWLANHGNALLRRTVYRASTLRALAAGGKWALPLPLTVRGVTLTAELLRGETPAHASAETARVLRLRSPAMEGDDVRAVQDALFMSAVTLGVYGEWTDHAVRVFQASTGLRVDGIVGPATRAALGL